MTTTGITVKMTPSHPGDFIRSEIIEELDLSVTKAAEILGVRRATLSALLNSNAASIAGDGPSHREGLRREHGHVVEDAGVVRRYANACSRRRD